jgi:aminocarboxymuconate-semialdehyde decarboxylase
MDCHAHAVPAGLLQRLAGLRAAHGFAARHTDDGWLVERPGADGPLAINQKMVDADGRREWCADRDISVQVLSAWMDIHPTAAMPAGAARDWARELNHAMLDLASAGNSGRAPVLASLTVHDPDQAAEDLRAAIETGMSGAILSTNPTGVADLAAPELEPLWAAAEDLDVPVMLHPPTDGPSSRLDGIDGYGNVYGRLIDSTLAVSRLILSGVLDRHPQLRLVLVHGGGFLPFQVNRFDGGHRLPGLNQKRLDREHPSQYLKDLYFDTVALSAESIRFLDSVVGSSRILLGSDYPFPLGGADPVRAVRASGLGENAVRSILGANASALFSGGVHV